jgi:hypothetical protein
MTTATIRAILALLIVGVFMVITAFMALYPLLMPQQVQLNDYADFFAKTSSVYTGIIGVIVGYYFGRSTTAKPQGETTDQQQGPKS